MDTYYLGTFVIHIMGLGTHLVRSGWPVEVGSIGPERSFNFY